MDQRPPRGSLRGPLASRRLRPVTAEGRHALVEVNAPAGRSSRGRGVRPVDRTPIVFACLPGPAPLSPRHSTPEPMHAEPDQAPSDPSWRTASQALDDLMRKLLVVHRPLEAEERLAKRRPGSDGRWPPPRVDRRPVPGQRGSPDGGQGGAKLVGNRRQEGVLLLVQGSQPSGGLTLGHGVVGDVDLHPLPVAGLAAVVVDKLGFVTEPDRAPIAGEHAVGAAKWFERWSQRSSSARTRSRFAGWRRGLPEIRGIAVLGGVSQAGLDLWALADPGAADAVVLDVGGGWDLPCPGKPCPWFHFRHQPPSFASC
jgi:hypothetical protein